MPLKRFLRVTSLVFIIAGLILILDSKTGFTGYVISDSAQNQTSILGILSILLGIALFMITSSELERMLGINAFEQDEPYQKYKKRLKIREALDNPSFRKLDRSIKEAVIFRNVPYKDAKRIYEESNKRVASGEWVELAKDAESLHKAYDPRYKGGTSFVRYWGAEKHKKEPKTELEYKKYLKELRKLYDAGEIGKTHEVARGSSKYANDISFPEPGSRILHRDWEIEHMYKRELKRTNRK
jgi:hypothetical protein